MCSYGSFQEGAVAILFKKSLEKLSVLWVFLKGLLKEIGFSVLC